MVKLILVIFAVALLFWFILKIFRPNSVTSEQKQKKMKYLLALLIIFSVILLISRTGLSPALIFQKILQILPVIRGFLPF